MRINGNKERDYSECMRLLGGRLTAMDIDTELLALATKVSALEERMNTIQQEYKTDIARLAEDAAKRETRMLIAIVGAIGIAAAILGVVISLTD